MRAPVPLRELASGQFSACVYGPPGVGKTTFACGSQKFRTMVLEIDQGTIASLCFTGDAATKIPGTRVDLVNGWRCTSFKDVLEAHGWLAANPSKYDLVVVDTATELQRMVLAEILAKTQGDVVDQRGWGIALSMMDELTRAFKHLGKHLIFNAHEIQKDDEYERRAMYQPSFQGAFSHMYARHFSVIMRYVLGSVEETDAAGARHLVITRALQCHKDKFSHAKDRFSALNMWERPFIDAIIDKVEARATQSLQGDHIEGNTSGARPKPASAPAGNRTQLQPAGAGRGRLAGAR